MKKIVVVLFAVLAFSVIVETAQAQRVRVRRGVLGRVRSVQVGPRFQRFGGFNRFGGVNVQVGPRFNRFGGFGGVNVQVGRGFRNFGNFGSFGFQTFAPRRQIIIQNGCSGFVY